MIYTQNYGFKLMTRIQGASIYRTRDVFHRLFYNKEGFDTIFTKNI